MSSLKARLKQLQDKIKPQPRPGPSGILWQRIIKDDSGGWTISSRATLLDFEAGGEHKEVNLIETEAAEATAKLRAKLASKSLN